MLLRLHYREDVQSEKRIVSLQSLLISGRMHICSCFGILLVRVCGYKIPGTGLRFFSRKLQLIIRNAASRTFFSQVSTVKRRHYNFTKDFLSKSRFHGVGGEGVHEVMVFCKKRRRTSLRL